MTTASAQQPGGNSQPVNSNKADALARRNPFMLPPEEQFWKRYSPHYEMPISGVISFLGHLLIGLGMIGIILLGAKLGWNRTQDIKFEAVRLPGGGGGDPNGSGDAPGVGTGGKEDVQGDNQNATSDVTPLPDSPPLDVAQVTTAKQVFKDDPAAVRLIQSNNPNMDAMMKNLNKDVIERLRDGMTPGKGAGGTGSGGGKDKGHGTGEGDGVGGGKGGKLSEREKRMLRWVMIFETQNPRDYVNQLAGLGAYIAIPTGREGEYKLIEKPLERPVRLEAKDVAALNRIYWVDDKPQSVRGVLQVLGVNMPASHFVAFMPQKLEAELSEKELQYARGRSEDEIFETKFKVVHGARGYDVVVTHQTFK